MTEEIATVPAPPSERKPKLPRGIFERPAGIYWVRYADQSGRIRREKAGTRAMATALLAKRRMEKLRGEKLPESFRRKAVTFGQIADAALAWSRLHKASWRQDETRFPLLKTVLGPRPAAEITPREISAALRRLAEDHAWRPATINRVKSLVSLAYRLAVEEGQVSANPARLVRQWKVDNARVRFLSDNEERRLREAIAEDCPQHMPELDLALNTGMRASEQYGLAWEQIDFERRQIALYRTKNGRPRYIPLNAPALAALLTLRRGPGVLRDEQKPEGATRDSGGGGLERGPHVAPAGERVFVNSVTPGRYHGQPRHSARNWFERAIERSGIAEFTWHCLRHTFASRLIMKGVDLRTVAELLGHRTLAMTMRYAHLAPEHNLAAVERLAHPQVQTDTRTGTGRFAAVGENKQVIAIQ